MRTARTIADREAELAAGLPRLAPQQEAPRPAPRQIPAEQDKAEKWPVRISMKASRDIAHDLEMARMADKIPPVTAHPGHDRALAGGPGAAGPGQQASQDVALIRICAST
jgi:hypothetical protein